MNLVYDLLVGTCIRVRRDRQDAFADIAFQVVLAVGENSVLDSPIPDFGRLQQIAVQLLGVGWDRFARLR